MARCLIRCHSTMRLLLKLLLFAAILQENSGIPTASAAATTTAAAATATAASATLSPLELSSPVPFTTRQPKGDTNFIATPTTATTTTTTTAASASANDEEELSYDEDYIETEMKGDRTTPTSMEQQDGPIVPPTTITFSNVAAAGILGDSSSNLDGGGTAKTFNDATPPYAAVDESYVPSKPQNLTVLDVTATSITMSWYPPKNQNGAIAGYHVFHIHENLTGVEIVKRSAADSPIRFELPKLKPFTEYRIKVNAFTTKNEGESSDIIIQRTDVGVPTAPIVVNLTCHSQDALTIRWKRPLEFFNNIDFYIIKTKIMGQESHRDIRINASAKELETAMIIQNLTMYQLYEVKVAAATYSVINPKKIVLGKFSEGKKIALQPNCEKIKPSLRQSHNDYNLAVLVGIIFSCFGIVLIVMAFFLWSRKCFHAAYYYLDDPPHHPNVPQVDWEVPVEIGGEIRAAVPVNEFAKHVASLHADGDIGFSREYEAIQNECVSDDLPCEHSQHPENKKKNRYLNITAYDHSRVHLHPTPGQKKNLDYINANFIDGYQKSRAFIGTQGPLPDTFDCFWRMIWEQRVAIIVMITNLVERGRRKCDMYWPKEGVETYGVIQVKLVEEEVMAMYTVRTFQIKHLKLKKKKQCSAEKLVYQYHYTNWPDHGTPDHPLPVLNFVKKSAAANPPDAGPIVVHCSAGVGRTGTYIVLDAMLKQIAQKGVVNCFGFLRHIRIQRNFLVQTEEQYIFIHDALVEAIASSETNLSAQQIEELKNCTPYLEQQYRNIIQFQTKDVHIASAMKQVNSIKNRGAIFPIEGSRVHLTPKPGEEGSDYINASWLHGFRRLRDFIVTQHPMAHTVKDFWQMVWDHNAQTIVLLSSLDEINFAQFWPDDTSPIESDYYRVKFLSKTNKSDYVSRDFVIQSIQDDYELSVKMLHCPSWPEMSNPNRIYDFIVDVHERGNDYRNGPIVVVDRYGGAQACTFCAISSLAIEMEYCQMANIYQYAKLYHNKRPGVWTSSEDIRLIYNILALLPRNLQLLKRTAIKTEIEDVTTATPDLYSKICSNGNNDLHRQQHLMHNDIKRHSSSQSNANTHIIQNTNPNSNSNSNPNQIQLQNSKQNPNSNTNLSQSPNSSLNQIRQNYNTTTASQPQSQQTQQQQQQPQQAGIDMAIAASQQIPKRPSSSSMAATMPPSSPSSPTPSNRNSTSASVSPRQSLTHNQQHPIITANPLPPLLLESKHPNHSHQNHNHSHHHNHHHNHHNHHPHSHSHAISSTTTTTTTATTPSPTTTTANTYTPQQQQQQLQNEQQLINNSNLYDKLVANHETNSNFNDSSNTIPTTPTTTTTTTTTTTNLGDGDATTPCAIATCPPPALNTTNASADITRSSPTSQTSPAGNGAPSVFQQQMLALLNQQQFVQHYAHQNDGIAADVDCDNITSYTPPPPPAAFNNAASASSSSSSSCAGANALNSTAVPPAITHLAPLNLMETNAIESIADYPMGYHHNTDSSTTTPLTPSTIINGNDVTTPLLNAPPTINSSSSSSSSSSSNSSSSSSTPLTCTAAGNNGACSPTTPNTSYAPPSSSSTSSASTTPSNVHNNLIASNTNQSTVTDAQSLDIVG